MKILKKTLFAGLFVLFPLISFAQTPAGKPSGAMITFLFREADDMLYRAGNEAELDRLYSLVDKYRSEITDCAMPVYVSGYCVSSGSREVNLKTAAVRSNRIKSELITNKGLLEEYFITKNHAVAYDGHKDIVVVTLFIPEEDKRLEPEIVPEQPEASVVNDNKVSVPARQEPENKIVATPPVDNEGTLFPLEQAGETAVPQPERSRYIALKTNIAAWAGTVMNAAIDIQVAERVSVELPVLWCPWKISEKHSVKIFAIQPEARWWLARPGQGHFFGVHAHAGWYNVRWKDNRYQDAGRPLLGAGVSYGYLLPLGNRWAGEFTLGAGYANTCYDTFHNTENGARFETRTRNYWGITRVGISLVYWFNAAK